MIGPRGGIEPREVKVFDGLDGGYDVWLLGFSECGHVYNDVIKTVDKTTLQIFLTSLLDNLRNGCSRCKKEPQ